MLGIVTSNTTLNLPKEYEAPEGMEEEPVWEEIKRRKALVLARLNFSIPCSEIAALFSHHFENIAKCDDTQVQLWLQENFGTKNEQKAKLWEWRNPEEIDPPLQSKL